MSMMEGPLNVLGQRTTGESVRTQNGKSEFGYTRKRKQSERNKIQVGRGYTVAEELRPASRVARAARRS